MENDSPMGACSVSEVRTYREMHRKPAPLGSEWDLCTITHGDNPGRYTAKLHLEGWTLIFQPFPRNGQELPERNIVMYGHGEEAERAVKSLGLRICELRRDV